MCVPNNWTSFRGGGGREPARGMSSKRVGRGGLGRDVLRPSVRPCVTLKKGPKGLQNHQSSIRFIDKSEKVKFYSVAKLRALAKCPFKLGFGITFGIANAKKRFSSRSRKFGVRWSQNGPFSTFEDFLSRNASIFALKTQITFIPTAEV